MYNEKLIPILNDLEDKTIEIAGGSAVGMVLAITNSLIQYICNLTIGKKNYIDVQDEVIKIKNDAEKLKQDVLRAVDEDKEVLENILKAYKLRKEEPNKLEEVEKQAVKFCIEVTKKALETLKIADRISKVGNKMLSSDFEISKYYAFASVEASIVNVKINLDNVQDKEFKKENEKLYLKLYEEAKKIKESK